MNNVGIGTVAAQFLFWEYLLRIFGIVSLQCTAWILTVAPSGKTHRAPPCPGSKISYKKIINRGAK